MPSESNFLLVTAPGATIDAQELAPRLYQQLKEDGVLVRYFDQPRLRDKLRITVGTAEENSRLLDCLTRYQSSQRSAS